MDIGTYIKQRRLELGYSQQEIAKACSVSKSAVSRWESGNITNMKRDRIAMLANVLQISPVELLQMDSQSTLTQPGPLSRAKVRKLLNSASSATDKQIEKAISYLEFLKQYDH